MVNPTFSARPAFLFLICLVITLQMSCLKVEHALAWLEILDSSDLIAWVQQMQSVPD